jgi:hypothetical protein
MASHSLEYIRFFSCCISHLEDGLYQRLPIFIHCIPRHLYNTALSRTVEFSNLHTAPWHARIFIALELRSNLVNVRLVSVSTLVV